MTLSFSSSILITDCAEVKQKVELISQYQS